MLTLGKKPNSAQHITVVVSNDLEHDQRVAKVCNTLAQIGYRITLVGRLLSTSTTLERNYEIRRFKLWFKNGIGFYAHLNLRLFFFLLFKKTDVILANDLDTLLPAYLVSRLRKKKLVYDSHEYFTEAEGLTGRKFQKKFWLAIEQWIFPRLKNVYTVNGSIAAIYSGKYNVKVDVVRNVPLLLPLPPLRSRTELDLPAAKRIIILQGAYIDPDRGAHEAVEAMVFVENAVLLVVGSGRDVANLKKLANEKNLMDRVQFYPKLPFEDLQQLTRNADLGLSLDKPVHLNYKYSLPNKLFDYIHAGIPVLASRLPEIEKVFAQYDIGLMTDEFEPQLLAENISQALASERRTVWKENLKRAAQENNWQKDEEVLKRIFGAMR